VDMQALFLVGLLFLTLCGRIVVQAAAVQEDSSRELANKGTITTGLWPGAIPPWEPFLSYLRGSSSADAQEADGSTGYVSFPTPGPKAVKQNPNAKCGLNVFGRCNKGNYCKSVSYDQYRCTKCEKNMKCTGDGKMGPQ
jgi:hypothetical protein